MRLINCLQYRLEEFFGSHIPPYVILSHTWEDEEVTFADFTRDQAGVRQKRGFQKLAYTCRQAQIDGYQWAWVDTCCIDKSSSAELSEAINSMFAWYKSAEICYVFLTDVVQDELQLTFPRSRWFTRGWTLQELLAPHRLVFYDQYWNRLGTKKEYAKWIAEITTIDTKALVFAPVRGNQRSFKPKRLLSSYCIARRMSWASQRQTTRLEDMSYSLLGLFDISMPLLYGEGARAFLRLHEEIIKRVDDDSILAWNLQMPTSAWQSQQEVAHMVGMTIMDDCSSTLLATAPREFEHCGILEYAPASKSALTTKNFGVEFELPLVPVFYPFPSGLPIDDRARILGYIGLLSCSIGPFPEFVGIMLAGTGETHHANMTLSRIKTQSGAATIVIESRAAAQSSVHKFFVQADSAGRDDVYPKYCRHVQVNILKALPDIAYEVTNGERHCMSFDRTFRTYEKPWDTTAGTLIICGDANLEDLLLFTLESSNRQARTAVTIFLRTDTKVIKTKRGLFSNRQYTWDLFKDMENQSAEEGDEDFAVVKVGGHQYRIVATFQHTKVHHWHLFTVDVDVVPIST